MNSLYVVLITVIASLITTYLTHYLTWKLKVKDEKYNRKRDAYLEVIQVISNIQMSSFIDTIIDTEDLRRNFKYQKLKLKLLVSSEAYDAVETWDNESDDNKDEAFDNFVKIAQRDLKIK
ncbi:hypothetical protein JEZ13_07760 [bacterium]|nr:hypothetical protein [bacterium]